MSPRQGGGFSLGDYLEVKERIPLFLEKYPDGRLVTVQMLLSSEPDGKPRVIVEAAAYRTADDPHPGTGWSWMELPGTTSYTKGSELENTETSAWGRAIASLGIGIGRSIASKNEVDTKANPTDAIMRRQSEPIAGFDLTTAFDAGLLGMAEKGTSDADFELRMTPEGHRLAFRLSEGRHKIKAIADGILAELIAENRTAIEGQTVNAWGSVNEESFMKPVAGKPPQKITYNVLNLTRIKVGPLDLTAPDIEEPVTDDDFEAGWTAPAA